MDVIGFIFSMILAAAIIMGAVIYWIAMRIRHLIEGRLIFRGRVDPVRALFMKECFGLDASSLASMHFDGRFFHRNGAEIPYQRVDSIRVIECKKVKIINELAPHEVHWKYTRLDGGPDLRYTARQVRTVYSTRCRIRLGSVSPVDILTAVRPGSSIEQIVEQLNHFLAMATKYDFEQGFDIYSRLAGESESLRKNIEAARLELRAASSAVAASSRLAARMAMPPTLISGENKIQEDLANRNLQVANLEATHASIVLEMKQMVQDVKDLDSVLSYRPYLARGHYDIS